MIKERDKVDLKQVFMKLQEQMISALSTSRDIIKHPSAKGNAAEFNWKNMLNIYLPKRYKVDKAFILDFEGNLSDEIDLVVYDHQYSPFLFHQDNAIFIPSESVYAVFEIKQNINKDIIEYVGGKARSVRRLKRTSVPIPHAGGKFKPKKPFRILSGILCLRSDWNPPLGNSFERAINHLETIERIDLGCVLQHGGFEVKYATPIKVEKSSKEDTLIFFFMRFLDQLQQLGTIPAIDIKKYARVLK